MNLTKGFHKHHINPRHAGGSDAPENLVLLHPIDHAIAHLVRYKMLGNVRDRWACNWLQGVVDPVVYTDFSIERERTIKNRRALDNEFDSHMHRVRSKATACRKEGYQKAAGQVFAERFRTDVDYAKPISENRKKANQQSLVVRRKQVDSRVILVRSMRSLGKTYKEIAESTKYSIAMISNILTGKSHVALS